MENDFSQQHISLVHDFFIMWGGAEVVADALVQAFPNHTLYASLVHKETIHKPLNTERITTSFLQKFPFTRTRLLELYKLLLPFAFEQFHFPSDTKLVVSDTASFGKYIIPPPGVSHISYIHTPPRFLWNMPSSKKARENLFLRFLWNLFAGSTLRISDFLNAKRVHCLIANSNETAKRIRKYYHREAIVLNPPVNVEKMANAIKGKDIKINPGFLAFGRIEAYKNFDTLVKIWPKGVKLTIAGKGSQASTVKKLAAGNPDITFINRYIPDEEKAETFASYTGFLYPNVEDFGIMMVEALAVGTPVITFRKGGGGEIVAHKRNGYLLENLTNEEMIDAVNWASTVKRSPEQRTEYYNNMLQYDIKTFITKIRNIATKYVKI